MLVLTRKSNQSIMIGDEIEVSVLSVMGEKVRIGIQAPQRVPVFRKEIYLEIHREAGAPAPGTKDSVTGEGVGKSAAEVDESLRELGDGS
jgi:carbon storage regulator